jgi:dihydrodipicolinate synthase/N-acetylneuraminate lyase
MPITRNDANTALRGIWALLPTPFGPNLELDVEGLRNNVRSLLDHDVRIFCMACGVGESWSLTAEESAQITAITKDEVGEHGIVVAGIGDPQVRRCQDLAAQLEAAGADLLMIMPPAYPKPEEDALFAFYAAIAEVTRLPFQIYPIEANPPFSFELIERMLEIENVVSIKDVSLNMSYSYNLQRRFGDQMPVIYGRRGETEARILYYHAIGMPGYYSNIVNFVPALANEYWAALQANDVNTVIALATRLEPYANLFPDMPEIGGPRRYRNIQILKAAMDACGYAAGPVRPPLVPLAPNEIAEVQQIVASM